MRPRLSVLLGALIVLCLAQCKTASDKPAAATGAKPSANDEALDDVGKKFEGYLFIPETKGSASQAGIEVPVLRSPEWEARYGKPRYAVMRDGSYIAYHKGGDAYLEIIGTPRTPPQTFGRGHGTTTVLGHRTPYNHTGNETPQITTHPVRLTAPDGRSAWYFIIHGVHEGELPELPKLAW